MILEDLLLGWREYRKVDEEESIDGIRMQGIAGLRRGIPRVSEVSMGRTCILLSSTGTLGLRRGTGNCREASRKMESTSRPFCARGRCRNITACSCHEQECRVDVPICQSWRRHSPQKNPTRTLVETIPHQRNQIGKRIQKTSRDF